MNHWKKNTKKILSMVCAVLLCMPFSVPATAAVGDVYQDLGLNGMKFREIEDNGWMVCAYDSTENTEGSLRISSSYELKNTTTGAETIYTMRGIEDGVFGTRANGDNCTFSEVVIKPSDNTTIGRMAFQGVVVEKDFRIDAENGKVQQIGENAFENAVIQGGDFTIYNLENCSIGANAFRNMQVNGKLELYGSIDTLGDYALSNLSHKGIRLPREIYHIGNYAFYNTQMTGAVFQLSDSLETLGSHAFDGTGLKAIQLPEQTRLTSVAADAFAGVEGLAIIMPQTADDSAMINLINQYHITASQNLVLQLPENLPADSSVTDYLEQNSFMYQQGAEGDIVKPEATAAPTDTPNPEQTNAPEETKSPDATKTPEVTKVPEDTASPVPTNAPENTTQPEQTKTPEDTASPVPTNAPENTTQPEQTKMPEATTKPGLAQKTEMPKQTVSPKGKVFSAGRQKYRVLTEKTAAFIGCTNRNVKQIQIPSSVKWDGRRYQVTAIAGNACKGYSMLKKVMIGNKVTSVGNAAFMNCKKLRQITYGKSVTTIGKNGLRGNRSLQTVTIKSKKLKSVGKAAFRSVPSNLLVKVPKKRIKTYKILINKAK